MYFRKVGTENNCLCLQSIDLRDASDHVWWQLQIQREQQALLMWSDIKRTKSYKCPMYMCCATQHFRVFAILYV